MPVHPLTVLESVQPPNERTNPYLPLLVASFPETVEARWFSWRRALLEPFDVFHLHWPEVRLRGRTPLRTAARWVLFLALLVRIRAQRKALVRTLHNASPHDSLPWTARALSGLADRWTTTWITMSPHTAPPVPGAVTAVVPHGHYRSWFASRSRAAAVPGRIVHVGLVRRYKGIDALLAAFEEVGDEGVSLRIVGATVDDDVAAAVRAACAADPRITARQEYVPDDELVREITESELVVLPFAAITNSGSVLLALSLDRPVLVPAGPMTEPLADEVGHGWVITYEGPLRGAVLEEALRSVQAANATTRPDLSDREWDAIGARHADVFAAAVAEARARPRRPARP